MKIHFSILFIILSSYCFDFPKVRFIRSIQGWRTCEEECNIDKDEIITNKTNIRNTTFEKYKEYSLEMGDGSNMLFFL